MRRRLAEAAAVVGLSLFLLAATQEWVLAVVEPAPGAPRVLVRAVGGAIAPWGPAGALVGLVAGVLSVLRWRGWTRLVLVTGGAVALVSACGAAADPGSAGAGREVVSAELTGWAWTAVAAAVLAVSAGALTLRGKDEVPLARPSLPDTAAEQDRRRSADQWRSLSDGHDPTRGA